MDIDPNQLSSEAVRTFYDDFSGAPNGASSTTFWNATTNSGTWDTLIGPTGVAASQTTTGSQMHPGGSEDEWFYNNNYASNPSDLTSPLSPGSGLTISATPLSGGDKQALGTNADYSSGLINSAHSYAQTYGYFEMDATLTDATGAWPGFWLLPDTVHKTFTGFPPEIDAMEIYTAGQAYGTPLNPSTLTVALHDDTDNDPNEGNAPDFFPISDSGQNEHKFGVDVEPDNITYWVGSLGGDGQWHYQQVWQFPTPEVFKDNDVPLYMIADLALGGAAGTPDASNLPSIHINSIEAYQAPGATNGYVYTGDLNYTAGPGVGYIFLQGDASQGPQTVHGNDTGDVMGSVAFVGSIPGNPNSGGIPQDPNAGPGGDSSHAPVHPGHGDTLIGGAGADTIYVSVADIATGGGGADTFVLDDVTNRTDISNTPAQITDFGEGNDVIDTHYMKAYYDQFSGYDLSLQPGSSDGEWDLWAVGPNGNTLQAVIDLQSGANGIGFADSSENSIIITNPVDTGGGGSSSVSTSASPYTAPAGVTDITLTGSTAQTVTGNNAGDTFHSNNNGNTLIGGTGNDTFDLGRGGDNVTGGGGSDTFSYAEVPWGAGHITDLTPSDQINLTGLLSTTGDTGGNPIGDGYLEFVDDGSGNADIKAAYSAQSDPNSSNWWTVAILDGVSASSLVLHDGIVTVSPMVATSAADYTAPAYITSITLTGSSAQHIDALATDGVTIMSDNNANTLIGGSGADMFQIGRAGDTVTGAGGADTFSFAEVPWGGSVITDFNASQGDRIDVSHLLATTSYTSGDPIAEGYLEFMDDGAGNALVKAAYTPQSDPGSSSWWTVATLDSISSSSLHYSGGLIT